MSDPTPNANYQIFPYQPATAPVPLFYLLPPNFTYPASEPSTPVLQLQLPWLCLPTADAKAAYQNADFSFGISAGNSLSVSLELRGGGNIWKTDAASRQALMGNFVDFLQSLETNFETNTTPTLVPGATFRIGQQIADNLPAPLVETLFYRYSLSPGLPPSPWPAYVDLRPGMRLRVETELKQFTSPSTPQANVYTSAGRFTYQIGSIPNGSGPRQLVFDPLTSVLRAPVVSGNPTSSVSAGGLFDLQPAGGRCAYWRIFYPPNIPPPTANGDTKVNDNVALVGASSLANLNQATSGYPNNLTGANLSAVFLGRAALIPEIPVWLTMYGATALVYVSLGTTITQLVEQFCPLPLDPQDTTVNVFRLVGLKSTGQLAPRSVQVAPVLNGQLLSPAFFDLPLIAGDNVSINF